MTTMKAILRSVLFISLLTSVGRPLSLSAVASAEAAAVGAGAQGIRPPALAHASTTQQPADDGQPRAYVTASGARLVIDEPQSGPWLDSQRRAMYAAVPWTALGAQPAGTAAAAPTVPVSQNPSELMLLNGVAAYTPVMGTRFARVSNTDSSVFWPGTAGTVYYRVPERWMRAHDSRCAFGARYGPATVTYPRGVAVYGPCGGAGYAARYNPRTGNDARGSAAWGPGRAGAAAQPWNPRTGPCTQAQQGPSGGNGAVSRSAA
jgi:hypothetical protein